MHCHNSHCTSSAQRASCQLMTVLHNTQSQLTSHQFCTTHILSTHDSSAPTQSQLTSHQFCTTHILSIHDSSAQHPVTTHITTLLHSNNNGLFCGLFLQIGAPSPLQRKEQNTVETNFHKHTTHTHTHPLTSQQLWQIIQQCAHS